MKSRLLVELPLIVAIRVIFNTMVRMVYPFLPVFGRGLSVDYQLMTLAVTLRSASGVLGPFLASVADVHGRKVGMLFGLAMFTLGVGLIAVWPTYLAFVFALILTMLGNLTFMPAMQAYLGDQVPYRQRGLVLGLTEFGWSLAFITGVPLMGLLIARSGWRAPFPWLFGAGLLALFSLALLIMNGDPPTLGAQAGLWFNLRSILNQPAALAGLMLGLSMSAANELVNMVFGIWLEDAFAVRITALAIASVIIGVSELGGESLVTTLTDRIGKLRAVSAGLIANIAVCLLLPWLGSTLTGALIALFLFYLTFEFALVSAIPMMTEVFPAARATLMAGFIACTAFGRALGGLIALPIYTLGGKLSTSQAILVTVLVAAFVNFIGVWMLRWLRSTGVVPPG